MNDFEMDTFELLETLRECLGDEPLLYEICAWFSLRETRKCLLDIARLWDVDLESEE